MEIKKIIKTTFECSDGSIFEDINGIIVVESFPCLIPSSYHEIELPKYFE